LTHGLQNKIGAFRLENILVRKVSFVQQTV